jgi:predicted DNA-binding transcriptional regulator AlpA
MAVRPNIRSGIEIGQMQSCASQLARKNGRRRGPLLHSGGHTEAMARFQTKRQELREIATGEHKRASGSSGGGNLAELPEILTAKELEGFLRIDVKTIYAYVQRGLIPYIRIQSNLRFRKQEVLDWIASQSHSLPARANGQGNDRG